MKNLKMLVRATTTLASVYVLSGCPQNTGAADSNEPVNSLGNPAVKKCIDSGYEVLPINTHGVPSGNWCINPKTQTKCEVWSFYRADCRL